MCSSGLVPALYCALLVCAGFAGLRAWGLSAEGALLALDVVSCEVAFCVAAIPALRFDVPCVVLRGETALVLLGLLLRTCCRFVAFVSDLSRGLGCGSWLPVVVFTSYIPGRGHALLSWAVECLLTTATGDHSL